MNTLLATLTLQFSAMMPVWACCLGLVVALLPSLRLRRDPMDREYASLQAMALENSLSVARAEAAVEATLAAAMALSASLDAGRACMTSYLAMVAMVDEASAIVAPVAPGAWLDALLIVRACSVGIA